MTSEEILQQLDDCANDYVFPMLDNGYVYPADVRLTAYRDETRWAIVLEQVGQSPRGGGHGGTTDALHVFGNCIIGPPGLYNSDSLAHTSDPGQLVYDEENCDWAVRKRSGSIMIREKLVQFDLSSDELKRKGISPAEEGQISAIDLLRSLLPEYRELLLATEVERRARIPLDIPEFLRIDEWHHPDLSNDEVPSQIETFQLLALAIVSGDISLYKPTDPPNTHWSNWPLGGTL